MMLVGVLPSVAQSMSIEEFKRQKKNVLEDLGVKEDKQMAILQLTTGEKGFQFKADGKTEVEAEEGDGVLTLKLPHKTVFLSVTHPDYGQLTWRTPDKPLKKKNIYHAYLQTYNPDKEYKLEAQWVIFQTTPRDAIIHIDSTTTITRKGVAQFHLPLGKHSYMVESPFYEPIADTLELTDERKLVMPITLQPVYSFLTVKTPFKECQIYVDNQQIGKHEAVSGRLPSGSHRLSVFVDSKCYYDAPVILGAAEKKVVTLSEAELVERPWRAAAKMIPIVEDSVRQTADAVVQKSKEVVQRKDVSSVVQASAAFTAPVSITAPDAETEIWIDREHVADGLWEGMLDEGFHLVNTRKDGQESLPRYIWVNDEFPKELNLGTPQGDYGLLNVYSNVVGASVYVNDSLRGVTPCIVDNLPAGKTCVVRLEQSAYKPAKQKVLVLGNNLANVQIIMKKRKN